MIHFRSDQLSEHAVEQHEKTADLGPDQGPHEGTYGRPRYRAAADMEGLPQLLIRIAE